MFFSLYFYNVGIKKKYKERNQLLTKRKWYPTDNSIQETVQSKDYKRGTENIQEVLSKNEVSKYRQDKTTCKTKRSLS